MAATVLLRPWPSRSATPKPVLGGVLEATALSSRRRGRRGNGDLEAAVGGVLGAAVVARVLGATVVACVLVGTAPVCKFAAMSSREHMHNLVVVVHLGQLSLGSPARSKVHHELQLHGRLVLASGTRLVLVCIVGVSSSFSRS